MAFASVQLLSRTAHPEIELYPHFSCEGHHGFPLTSFFAPHSNCYLGMMLPLAGVCQSPPLPLSDSSVSSLICCKGEEGGIQGGVKEKKASEAWHKQNLCWSAGDADACSSPLV